jgi:enamine deaminase RidA (YjgF/YER057c/UK114 family)
MSRLVTPAEAAPLPGSSGGKGSQLSITIQPQPGEGIAKTCLRLATQLREQLATPLHLLIFGDIRAGSATRAEFQKIFGRVNWPMTWVEGAALDGRPVAGMQVHAFTGDVERIESGGRVVGSVFTEGGARQCLLGGIEPADRTLARAQQALDVFETLQAFLAQAGLELEDTVRTWFFLDNILSWYDDFNRVRTKVYSGLKFRTGSLPASTGIGARNPAGAALALAAWAFRPLEPNARAKEIASPLQCPAPAYGSSFSRAMEVSSGAGRRLFLSGTASISPGGKTMWVGDARKQTLFTMEALEAILRSRNFSFGDLACATAYFRRPADAVVFVEWLKANGMAEMPVIFTQCDICRDELLFEIEAEAKAP